MRVRTWGLGLILSVVGCGGGVDQGPQDIPFTVVPTPRSPHLDEGGTLRLGIASFGPNGARIALGAHQVSFGADTLGHGQGETLPIAAAVVNGDDVQLARGAGVTEWWRTTPDGLEHGVTIAERPDGEGTLVVELRVDDARPRTISPDAIALEDASGAPLGTYTHLVVVDARETRLDARMSAGADRIRIEVDDASAVYPVVIDPLLIATEGPTLVAAGAAAGDNFGCAVAISSDGTRAIIGACADDTTGGVDAGSARVFTRSGAAWTEEATLLASGGAAGDHFGTSVAISMDGSRAIVGAPDDDTAAGADAGSARVFVRAGTTWMQEATLAATGLAAGDAFGFAVAISADGSRALVGAPRDDTSTGSDAGSVRVFLRTTTSWAQEATVVSTRAQANAAFGSAVALSSDGARALIGEPAGNAGTITTTNAGIASRFARTGVSWASEGGTFYGPLTSIDGHDQFGGAAALSSDGSVALVGAARTTFGGGNVFVSPPLGAFWLPTPADPGNYGTSVSINGAGTRAVAGDAYDAHVYERGASAWAAPITLIGADTDRANDGLGRAVTISADGSVVLVGAPADDTTGGNDAGSVRVFSFRAADSNGTACTTSATCLSDFCVDGVCCESACGGGAADCMACSATLTGGAAGTCAPLSATAAPTITCRVSTVPCDAAEVCSPTSTTCPADGVASTATICAPATTACDAPEHCDGTTMVCPANQPAAGGTECRASFGPCDIAETCDGTSYACPGDGRLPAGSVCRSVMGLCDTEEHCDGTGIACPPDTFVVAGTVCRPSVGPCDVADVCNGSSAGCGDTFVAPGTECAPAGPDVCDAPDVCTGSSAPCVPTFRTGIVCRAASGACDHEEVCSGTAASCPPDSVEVAGMTCRTSTAPCDPGESCDGTSTSCPTDVNSCSTIDSGARDASVSADGSVDAAVAIDAAVPPTAAAGCGCRTSGRSTRSAWWVVAVGIGILVARLRRRERA